MKIHTKLLLILVLFLLSGCFGSYYEPEPVGIGKVMQGRLTLHVRILVHISQVRGVFLKSQC